MGLKARIVGWLRSLAAWLEGGECLILYVPKDALYMRAVVLCAEAESYGTAGEQRRHQVYARLLKEFPTRSKRTVALAIEAGL